MTLFSWWKRRKIPMAQQIRENIETFNEEHVPSETVPKEDPPPSVVLGEDVDLVRLVKELAPKQLERLERERARLAVRLIAIEAKEKEIKKLLA